MGKCKRCKRVTSNLENRMCLSCLECSKKRVCYVCGQPIVGHSVNGMCHMCYIDKKADEELHEKEIMEGNDIEGLIALGAVKPIPLDELIRLINREHEKYLERTKSETKTKRI